MVWSCAHDKSPKVIQCTNIYIAYNYGALVYKNILTCAFGSLIISSMAVLKVWKPLRLKMAIMTLDR